MIMRTHTLITYLRPEDAYTLVEFLDQVRDMLVQTYGDEIRSMLQDASSQKPADAFDDDLTL